MLLEDEGDKMQPHGCKYLSPLCVLRHYKHISYLFQQLFFVLVYIHPGTPRVPPRVLASGPLGQNAAGAIILLKLIVKYFLT